MLDSLSRKRRKFLITLYKPKGRFDLERDTDIDNDYLFNDVMDLTPELRKRVITFTQDNAFSFWDILGASHKKYPLIFCHLVFAGGVSAAVGYQSSDLAILLLGLVWLGCALWMWRSNYITGMQLFNDLARVSTKNKSIIEKYGY